MKGTFCIIYFLLTSLFTSLFSQEHFKYDWDKNPALSILNETEKKEGTVVIKDKRIVEFFYNEKGNLSMYQTRHLRIKVNNDKSIEENNRVYIPMGEVVRLIDLKARSLGPDGKVKILDKNSIKIVDNYENLGPFRIFAFEGAEVGSELEYLYTVEKNASLFGTEKAQSDDHKRQFEFSLYSPENLIFEGKSYNGIPEPVVADIENAKRSFHIKAFNLPGIKEERYSAYKAMLGRIEYKLAINLLRGNTRTLTWNDAAERYYSAITYLGGDAKTNSEAQKNRKKTEGVVAKYLKSVKVEKDATPEQKVREMESELNNNSVIKEASGQGLDQPDKILVNKYGNALGMTRLFVEIFRQLKIENQIVITSDRTATFFDPDFDTWHYLDHFLMYFPGFDNYMAPGMPYSRLGVIPSEWMCHYGLFVTFEKPSANSKDPVPIAKINAIPCPSYKLSYDSMFVKIQFGPSLSSVTAEVKRSLSGFSAAGLQAVYNLIPSENQLETRESLLKFMGDDAKVSSSKVFNANDMMMGVKPFVLTGEVTLGTLLESAGDKTLFHVGMTIGPQVELYQERERRLPVENEYNRGYYREISFPVPDGYKITNLDALNMKVVCTYDGTAAEFVSWYKQDGKMITVFIEENYREIRLPLEKFEDFRKVINAAADFNKITLFFERVGK